MLETACPKVNAQVTNHPSLPRTEGRVSQDTGLSVLTLGKFQAHCDELVSLPWGLRTSPCPHTKTNE